MMQLRYDMLFLWQLFISTISFLWEDKPVEQISNEADPTDDDITYLIDGHSTSDKIRM